MSKQLMLVVVLLFYGLGLYELILHSVQDGVWWIAPLVGWMCSPILLCALRVTVERGTPEGLFSPKTQSWAFLFGDWLFLPASLVALAVGASKWYQEAGFGFVTYDSYVWREVCLFIGVLAGIVFNAIDRQNYANAGALSAVFSPTKIAHDFVAYPVFVASLLYLAGPLFGTFSDSWPSLAIALAGVVLWAIMGVRDGQRRLHPFDLHPSWDAAKFQQRQYLPRNLSGF